MKCIIPELCTHWSAKEIWKNLEILRDNPKWFLIDSCILCNDLTFYLLIQGNLVKTVCPLTPPEPHLPRLEFLCWSHLGFVCGESVSSLSLSSFISRNTGTNSMQISCIAINNCGPVFLLIEFELRVKDYSWRNKMLLLVMISNFFLYLWTTKQKFSVKKRQLWLIKITVHGRSVL